MRYGFRILVPSMSASFGLMFAVEGRWGWTVPCFTVASVAAAYACRAFRRDFQREDEDRDMAWLWSQSRISDE